MNYLEEEQPLVYRQLSNMIKKGHVPHALIFYGDSSSSKKEMAKYFIKLIYAKWLNVSLEESYMSKKIDEETSLNVFWIKKDKKTVTSVDVVREYVYESNQTSLEEGPRFFIFEDADSLNINASNALLKFVEEPIDDVYIIFIIENLNNLLDTIISRCQLINFRPLNINALHEKLRGEYPEYILNPILEYTQKEERVREIIRDEEMMSIYNLVIDMFSEKYELNDSIILILNEEYSLLNDDVKQDFFISLMIIYLRDILNIFIGNDDIKFISEKDRIIALASYYTKEKISTYIKDLLEIKRNVNNSRAINLHLHLDTILLKMEMGIKR